MLFVLVVVWFSFRFGVRMAVEVGRYANGALAHRSSRVQTIGWLVGLSLGWSLWLPLMIFNWLVFKTPYPVTNLRLQPRRI
jgi:hypothetical protein